MAHKDIPGRDGHGEGLGERLLKAFLGNEAGNKVMEHRTGMTEAQRLVARDPDAEFPLYLLTDEEMDVWREGGDWTQVGPSRDYETDMEAG